MYIITIHQPQLHCTFRVNIGVETEGWPDCAQSMSICFKTPASFYPDVETMHRRFNTVADRTKDDQRHH